MSDEGAPSIAGARVKVRRARQQREQLSAVWAKWTAAAVPLGFKQSPPDADGWVDISWASVPPFPEEAALLWGELLYNARAALDYLAWQLVLLGGAVPTRTTAWPVVTDPDRWDPVSGRLLKGVLDDHLELARTFQPFEWLSGEPNLHPLALLDELNNLNKHRLPQQVLVQVHRMEPVINFVRPVEAGTKVSFSGPVSSTVESGGLLIRLRVDPPCDFDVDFPGTASVALSFADGLMHDGPFPSFADEVEAVLDRFEAHF